MASATTDLPSPAQLKAGPASSQSHSVWTTSPGSLHGGPESNQRPTARKSNAQQQAAELLYAALYWTSLFTNVDYGV